MKRFSLEQIVGRLMLRAKALDEQSQTGKQTARGHLRKQGAAYEMESLARASSGGGLALHGNECRNG